MNNGGRASDLARLRALLTKMKEFPAHAGVRYSSQANIPLHDSVARIVRNLSDADGASAGKPFSIVFNKKYWPFLDSSVQNFNIELLEAIDPRTASVGEAADPFVVANLLKIYIVTDDFTCTCGDYLNHRNAALLKARTCKHVLFVMRHIHGNSFEQIEKALLYDSLFLDEDLNMVRREKPQSQLRTLNHDAWRQSVQKVRMAALEIDPEIDISNMPEVFYYQSIISLENIYKQIDAFHAMFGNPLLADRSISLPKPANRSAADLLAVDNIALWSSNKVGPGRKKAKLLPSDARIHGEIQMVIGPSSESSSEKAGSRSRKGK